MFGNRVCDSAQTVIGGSSMHVRGAWLQQAPLPSAVSGKIQLSYIISRDSSLTILSLHKLVEQIGWRLKTVGKI